MKGKINVITLGCSKNVVDSEKIMSRLERDGWEVVFDSDEAGADVVIINTCGFIGDAKEESVEMILKCAEAKTKGLIGRLYVIGCLSERYRDELRNELPEVDDFFGARNIEEVVSELGTAWEPDGDPGRKLTTPRHYAFLKISEGCNRACGFCAIPLIRGDHRSVPIEHLLEEARSLAAQGVKELLVIAQDTTFYGMDLYGERKLAELLHRLCLIDGIEWIRLHYAYPAGFPEDVIGVMASDPKICKYLDIPLQHISDSQLRSMRRGNDKQETYSLIARLRKAIPDIAIRTTLLTGYPGESIADFDELCEFVREVKFDRLGVFPYSEEEGTYSAANLTDDVPQEVKQERADRIMFIQQEVSLNNNLGRVGREERVIIDRVEEGYYIARSQYDSPEVDQEILIPVGKGVQLKPGDFTDVIITAAEAYDLFAEQAGRA